MELRKSLGVLALVATATAAGCTGGGGDAMSPAQELAARARELADRLMIVDTHIDVPYRLRAQLDAGETPADVAGPVAEMDFDYPRAVSGGLDLPFMSIYIPAGYQDGRAKAFADELIDQMEGVVASAPDKFAIVTSTTDAERAVADGKIGFAWGMENGAPIEGDLDNLRHFHERGIRYVTLTHSKDNHICDSSYDDTRTWSGLSPFGRELIPEMNRLGVMIDISHVSDDAFYQVLSISQAPVIASHSSCRKYTPGWEHNMSDDMIRALGAAGGVIQINFGSSFISDAYRAQSQAMRDHLRSYFEQNEIARDSDEGRAYVEQYRAENPIPFADLADVVEHIEHVVSLVGVDHVGIGSDYDGVGDSLPTGLKDVASYPNLIGALLEKGYTEEEIEKICSGNLMRVWRKVEAIAEAG